MRSKITLSDLFLVLMLIGFCATFTNSQQSSIKSDDLLKLRNLQYEHAKCIVKMQDLKNEFDRLNVEQQKIAADIDNWIKEQAKINNIDLTKNAWDSDQLKFVEIKKNE